MKNFLTLFVLTFLVIPFSVSAAPFDPVVYEWEQTLFGTGILSEVSVNYQSATMSRFVVGQIGLAYTDLKSSSWWDTNAYTNVAKITSSPLTTDSYSLEPNKSYYLASGNSAASASALIVFVMQQAQAATYPNTTQAFPQSPTQHGFIYFETNDDSEIACYSVSFTTATQWLDCENIVPSPAPPNIEFLPYLVSDDIASSTCLYGNGSSSCTYHYVTTTSTISISDMATIDIGNTFMLAILCGILSIFLMLYLVKKEK